MSMYIKNLIAHSRFGQTSLSNSGFSFFFLSGKGKESHRNMPSVFAGFSSVFSDNLSSREAN